MGKVGRKILGAIQTDVWNAYDKKRLLKIQRFDGKFQLHLKETKCRFNHRDKNFKALVVSSLLSKEKRC